jgi:pimeloyl-ACP methyl ester carboxylesterase
MRATTASSSAAAIRTASSLACFAAALALLAACGSEQRPFAKRFDIGGYTLFLECHGHGDPTVLLEAGLGGDHVDAWQRIEGDVRRETRTCAYDRAGLGRSDPRPGNRPAPVRLVASELHNLLDVANVDRPFVYVGHSIGGIYSLAYSKDYPDEVAGAVYVDGTDPFEATGVLGDGAGGVDYGGPYPPLLQVRLGDRPAIFLSAVNSGKEYLKGSTNGRLVEAVGSGHGIQDDNPDLVLEAIREVVESVRSGDELPPCKESGLPKVGGRCLARLP